MPRHLLCGILLSLATATLLLLLLLLLLLQPLPAAWFFVVVKLCFPHSFKHISSLFGVFKQSATVCLNARKRVVSARFRGTIK